MLLLFQNPSIFQPLMEQYPPLLTQQYLSLMPEKRTILPHPHNFLYSPLFSQQTTRAKRRVHTLLVGTPPQAAPR